MQPQTEEERALAESSGRSLSSYAEREPTPTIQLVEDDQAGETVEIPAAAFRLLIEALDQMARGNAVRLVPVHAELTSRQAAELLNVSRPHLVKLLASGEIPHHKVGAHHRVRLEDVLEFKKRLDARRNAMMDQLVEQAQELGLGY